MTPIRVNAPFHEAHPTALALYCSDGRFTRAVEELVAQFRDPQPDVMCLPGGPGLLSVWTSSVIVADEVQRSAEFLIDNHAIRTVYLIAHEHCGYYRARYPNLDDAGRVQRQFLDLRDAAAEVAARRPRVTVRAFFAAIRDGHLEFDTVGGQ